MITPVTPSVIPITLVGRVVEDLKSRIESGEYAPGLRLPSFKSMAKNYAVSAITIQSATLRLANQGYVESRPRSGVYVDTAWQRKRASAAARSWNRLLSPRRAIGVLAPALSVTYAYHRQPGWSEMATMGVLKAIQEKGYHAFALNIANLPQEYVNTLADDGLFGVLAPFPAVTNDFSRSIVSMREAGLSVVAGNIPDRERDYDGVDSDHEFGGYLLTRWLIDRGRKKPLMVWSKNAFGSSWLALREKGYVRAMTEAGLTPLRPLVWSGPDAQYATRELFVECVRSLAGYLVEPLTCPGAVDSLMLDSDGNVVKAAAACRIFGKTPNVDVAIVGYDNYWSDLPERAYDPFVPLATVDKDNASIGVEMVRLLLARSDGALPDAPQLSITPVRLIVPPQSADERRSML